MHILLVEDDPATAYFIKKGFTKLGDELDIAVDGISGKRLVLQNKYDLAILDIILPCLNGFELCRQIRLENTCLPILMLTGLSSIKDRVEGLRAGGDDYLVKPFHFAELLARVRALYRRGALSSPDIVHRIGDLEVDVHRMTVYRAGRLISLSRTEFAVLRLLILYKGSALSKHFITHRIWGEDAGKRTNVACVYINYLRGKIDKGFATPLIHTVPGGGYMIKER